MKVFTLTGLTGSGKTSVAEKVIAELKVRGYTVGSVKEIHFEAFKIDTEGKNTWRHRQAGAGTVTARAHNETDVMYVGHLPIYEVLSHYSEDFVLLEGVRDAVVPEIAMCKEDELPELTPLTIAVSGRFANNNVSEYHGVPVIDGLRDTSKLTDLIIRKTPELMYDIDSECCGICGNDCRTLLAKILKGEASSSDCALKHSRISLRIDGKDIVIVPFVEKLLKNAVTGVVKELKGYKKGGKIQVEFVDEE